ncbi:MAG: hypothetical protein ABIG44_14335 [Planctomycetota bacterium]
MEDSKRVELDDSVEYLFGRLFGAPTAHTFSRTRGFTQWRKDLVRVFGRIDTALDLNLRNADDRHRRELKEFLQITIEQLKNQPNKDKLHTRAISSLIRIVFDILGGLPNHWSRTGPIPRGSWKLDQYRSLIYSYSETQRAQLLLSTLDVDERFKRPLKDADAIQWFKEQFPEKYLSVF